MGNNVTFDEMNELLDEIYRSRGKTWVEIDGQTYYTDWEYGAVAIVFFIRMLKNRKSDNDATLVRHNGADDARSLIDDEVHRDCEYYVYSQLRDCIDEIDDDYECLESENAKLRALLLDAYVEFIACCGNADEAAEYADRMRELGIEVDA